ncbi:MAG TPA: FliH/SctL family protein [Verrucomicrobiae bacterium]|nr:FliH/SctL family protein [Verrucomicrobiae bacterium]
MSDAFVPLMTLLREVQAPPVEPIDTVTAPPPREPIDAADDDAVQALASDVRRFRAHLADAFDAALGCLLQDVACSVVARELELAPAQIATIAAAALQRASDELPLGLRAHADDCAQLQGMGLPVTPDAALQSGDLILELRDGELDFRLGVRLDAILRAASAS